MVRPKSCEWRFRPAGVATSNRPPMPNTVLMVTRMKLSVASTALPCSRLLTTLPTSPMLAKKLVTALRTGCGVTAL